MSTTAVRSPAEFEEHLQRYLYERSEEGRAVLIGLNPGQELGDHQVKEHAFIVVADGSVRIEAGGETLEAGAGTLVKFEPDERHVVASDTGAKILLLLAPWPGEGHYRGSEPPPS